MPLYVNFFMPSQKLQEKGQEGSRVWKRHGSRHTIGTEAGLCKSITWVILEIMKTAISIRDEVFEAGERAAERLGISRSELYTKAVGEFVARHAGDGVTERLNAVYGEDPAISALDKRLEALQFLSLHTEDEW